MKKEKPDHIHINIDKELKLQFRMICLEESYDMSEALNDYIKECVKKGRIL